MKPRKPHKPAAPATSAAKVFRAIRADSGPNDLAPKPDGPPPKKRRPAK